MRQMIVRALICLIAFGCLPVLTAHAQKQVPVKLIVGYPPGGVADSLARILAEDLRNELGRNVIVENKSGAGGRIAGSILARSEPDGNTYLIAPDGWAVFPHLIDGPSVLNYDILTDMAPVARLSSHSMALVVSEKIGVTNAKEYEEYVKTKGEAIYGVPSIRGHAELLGTFFTQIFKVPFSAAGYRGNVPLATDLISGQIPAGVMVAGDIVNLGDKVRIIAIIGQTRSPVAPDVPTLAEQGYPLNVGGGRHWMGMWAPKGTPKEEIAKMEGAVKKVVTSRGFSDRILKSNLITADFATGKELDKIIREDIEFWEPIVEKSGMKTRN
ncbi:MAG TPA: tripartite tricarboxylate transporter substrate-binding protein [Eoetvoesiella sp.]